MKGKLDILVNELKEKIPEEFSSFQKGEFSMTAVYKKIVDQKINMSFSMTQSGLDHS
jgi:hypothetical protein